MNQKRKILLTLMIVLAITAIIIPLSSCGGNSSKISEIYVLPSDTPKLSYVVGQELDLSSGLLTTVVEGVKNKIPLNAPEVSVSGYNKDLAGEQVVTIEYFGHTTTITVTVVERVVPEKFETKYFVGDVFNAEKGRLKITTDDAKTVYVNMNDAKVSVVAFDSTKAGVTKVTLCYKEGDNSYTFSFDVNVYEQSEVTFTPPTKTQYFSHENAVDVNNGYFTVTSTDGALTVNVPLTASMVSGFDLSKATIENRTSPLEQNVTVTYLDKTFTYKIKITFSGVSAVNYYVNETLSKINWTNAIENGLSDNEQQAALTAINEYYGLVINERALLSTEAQNTVARAASIAVYDLFRDELPEYADTFAVNQDGNIHFVESTYEKTAKGLEKFNEPSAEINVYANLLRKIKADFGETILAGDTKIGDHILIYSEELERAYKDVLNHLVTVFSLIKDIPEDWDVETLKPYDASLVAAVMQIYNAGYYKNGYNSYYTNVLSSWREKNDVFEILYTHFLYSGEDNTEFMQKYMWGSMPMPGILEDWYRGLLSAVSYSNLFQNNGTESAYLMDLTAYMYNYFHTLDICEEIKNSGDQFLIDIYNTYEGDNMNRNYMYTYSYGYLMITGGMIDSEAHQTLWNKYYKVLDHYYDKTLSTQDHKEEICAMFDAFEDLSPAELLGFLTTLNLMYTDAKGMFPMLGHTEAEGNIDGKVYNVFSYILSANYGMYFNEANRELFNDLLSAMESFVLVGYKEGAIEEFNTKMQKLSSAVNALSADNKANFMEYCGKSYDKYFEIYEITSGKVSITLTAEETALFDELKDTLEKLLVVYNNIYAIIQQGKTVAEDAYPILYSLYARATEIRETIYAMGEHAILAMNAKEYDILGISYSLEKSYCIADNAATMILAGKSANLREQDGAVINYTFWEILVEFEISDILSDMADVFYSAYFTDGKPVEYSMFVEYMAKRREFNPLQSSIFAVMSIDDTFYRALNVYYKTVLSDSGLAVSNSLVNVEKAYVNYFVNTNDGNRTAFINAMESLIPEYEKLSAEDKAYLSDMYNYYAELLAQVKNETETN